MLSCFALFVLFLFIGRVLPIVIRHVYLISKLDPETAAFDPGCLGLQRHGTWRQAVEDVVVDAGDHVWRLDEGEAERGSQVDSCRTVNQWSLYEGELIAETRLGWEDGKVDAFFLLAEANEGLAIVLFGTFQVFLSLGLVSTQLMYL